MVMKRLQLHVGSWAEIRHPNQSVHPSRNIPSEMWNSKWKQKVGRRIFSVFFETTQLPRSNPALGSWSCRCQIVLQGRGQDMIARTTILLYMTRYSQGRMYESFHLKRWIRIRSSIRGISPAVLRRSTSLGRIGRVHIINP